MPKYADISDSDPVIPSDLGPGAAEELDTESMAELRLPREPAPPTGAIGNAVPEWVAVGDCCWFRSAKSTEENKLGCN